MKSPARQAACEENRQVLLLQLQPIAVLCLHLRPTLRLNNSSSVIPGPNHRLGAWAAAGRSAGGNSWLRIHIQRGLSSARPGRIWVVSNMKVYICSIHVKRSRGRNYVVGFMHTAVSTT